MRASAGHDEAASRGPEALRSGVAALGAACHSCLGDSRGVLSPPIGGPTGGRLVLPSKFGHAEVAKACADPEINDGVAFPEAIRGEQGNPLQGHEALDGRSN
eukprot:4198794-Alexandrium_andersonii.AAC.1